MVYTVEKEHLLSRGMKYQLIFNTWNMKYGKIRLYK